MSKETQRSRVMAHLVNVGPITNFEAIGDLGILHLASRISELKRDGAPIRKEMVTVKNRFGEDCRVARYSLEGTA